MINVRTYLQKKAEREAGASETRDFGALIQKHRLIRFGRALLAVLVFAVLGTLVYVQMKNQVYTGYVILSSISRQQYDGSTCLSYGNGFLSYSGDGISYTDAKGNAVWNQAYEMQEPLIRVAGGRVAAADYNGHIIYSIAQDGSYTEINFLKYCLN